MILIVYQISDSDLVRITVLPYSFTGAVGLSFLQFTNMNSMRNLFIIGLSLFLGISIPQFFYENSTLHHGLVRTDAGWVNIIFYKP